MIGNKEHSRPQPYESDRYWDRVANGGTVASQEAWDWLAKQQQQQEQQAKEERN